MGFEPIRSRSKPAADVLVVTRDGALLEVVAAGVEPANVEARFDAHAAAAALRATPFAVVVLDDEALTEGERAWMIDEAHRRIPETAVVYVASNHSAAIERAARSHGVVCYTAKPIEGTRIVRVIAQVLRRRSMESSFGHAPEAGLYRSECCGHVLKVPRGKMLPLCPRCHEETEWDAPSAPTSPSQMLAASAASPEGR